MTVIETKLQLYVLRNFMDLEWSKEQEVKLRQAFLLIDEVMLECKKADGQRKELNAIAGPRYTVDRIVAAFSIKQNLES